MFKFSPITAIFPSNASLTVFPASALESSAKNPSMSAAAVVRA